MGRGNKLNKEIGKMIRDARIKNKMSRRELAQRLGFRSEGLISRFEQGLCEVPLHTLAELFAILIPESSQDECALTWCVLISERCSD